MKISPSTSLTYLTCLLLCIAAGLKAQQPSVQIAIKTSVVCETCKKNIEKALTFKGIEKVEVDLKTQIVTVSFDPRQACPEKIEFAISKAGYDADDLKARPKAYKKLDKCCKKENEHF